MSEKDEFKEIKAINKEVAMSKPSTKWNNFLRLDPKEILERVCSKIETCRAEINRTEYRNSTTSKESWQLRKEIELTEARLDAISKGRKCLEVPLERLLTAFCDKKKSEICNQFNLLSGVLPIRQTAKAVDLVIVKNNKIIEMIELKGWSNDKDDPVAAAIELISNYYIHEKLIREEVKNRYGKTCPKSINLKLTVLAPRDYYNFYFRRNPGKMRKIESAIKGNLQNEGVEFSFQVLSGEFSEQDLKSFAALIRNLRNSFTGRKPYIS